MKYKFETNELGISESAIHLLRNRYNYQTLAYQDIDRIEIGKGRLINNWMVVFVLGLVLTTGAIYYAYTLYLDVTEERVPRLLLESFVVPVIPLFMGVYCLWNSLRIGETMTIVCNGKGKSFPLVKLSKDNQLEALRVYLESQENLKVECK